MLPQLQMVDVACAVQCVDNCTSLSNGTFSCNCQQFLQRTTETERHLNLDRNAGNPRLWSSKQSFHIRCCFSVLFGYNISLLTDPKRETKKLSLSLPDLAARNLETWTSGMKIFQNKYSVRIIISWIVSFSFVSSSRICFNKKKEARSPAINLNKRRFRVVCLPALNLSNI